MIAYTDNIHPNKWHAYISIIGAIRRAYIDDRISGEAARHYERSLDSVMLNDRFTSNGYVALIDAFSWQNTPQGHQYWLDLNRIIEDYPNMARGSFPVQPEPIPELHEELHEDNDKRPII